MPYSSVSELPDAVKKLPAKKQRQFMHVFNSAYSKCKSEGGSDCETRSFKQAWSVINKSDENFVVRAIKHFADMLALDFSVEDEGIDIDTDIDKSLVYWYPGSSYSYAIDGNNILDLGPIPPADMEMSGDSDHAPYALVVRRGGYESKMTVELASEGELADIQAKAIKLVEDGKNEVRSVAVCKYINKTFAGRPVYQTIGKYEYISKSDERREERYEEGHAANIDKSTAAINDLPDSAFAYIEPGGSKDESGKTTPRSKRHFPIHNPDHVRNALARVNQSPFGKKALPKIITAAKKFGIKIEQGMAASHLKKEYLPYVCELEKEDFEYLLESAALPKEVSTTLSSVYDKLHAISNEDVSLDVRLLKGSIHEGLVYGIVYAPLTKDSHGDWTSAGEIENAAHTFLPAALKSGGSGWTDINHKDGVDDVEIVESYIAPVDFEMNGEAVSKGSWVIVSRVNDEALRAAIEKGEITGYSLEGKAKKVDLDTLNVL